MNIRVVLSESGTTVESKDQRPKRPGKRWRWVLALLCLLAAGLLWLNGPGLRYLAPKVVAHFLEKAGIRGNLKVGGSLIAGLSVSDLTIETNETLEKLTIDHIVPDYHLSGLIKGQLEGLTIDGVHAELRLGVKKKDERMPPLDMKKLVEAIRSGRGRVLPLNLDLKNISLAASRDGKQEFQLAPSWIYHTPGSQEVQLELGTFTDVTGRKWEARKSTIVWNPDDLAISRIDPFPGVSLREFVLQLPAGGEPSMESDVHLDDAVFKLTSSPGFAAAQLDLREGKLQVDEAVKRFGIELPAKGTLISLAVDVNGILPDPKAATGSVRISLDDVAWRDWTMPELTLDAQLGTDLATVVSHGIALGTPLSLDVAAPVTRDGNRFTLGDAKGNFNVADVPMALRGLAARLPQIDPDAPVPPSSVDGKFSVTFDSNKPVSADTDLILKPQDPTLASSVAVKGRWAPDVPINAEVLIDGLKSAVSYQVESGTYQGTMEMEEFTSSRIDRWLSIVKVKPGGIANLTAKWSGGGDIRTRKHRGEISFTQATWSRETAAPITGIGSVKYDWPAGIETQGVVQMNDQTVALDAVLANGQLELRRFVWNDAKTELASGTATLPVPEDFSKWREALAKDTRPVAVAINSRVLSLGLLKQWVPAFEKLDPRSTGQLDFNVSGTFANPVIAAKLQARDLRSPTQPSLPPADLKIELAGKDGKIALTGSATAPDFAPAEMKASMPFRPAEWAETPALLKEEVIDARVDLPRLDLSRFASLVPGADKISGLLTGSVAVKGKVGKPEIKGSLDLASAGMRFKGDKFPAVEAGAARVEFGLERVELKTLKATIAGGTLQGGGTLAITNGKLGDINLRLQGDHLPVMRNDFLILRVNADLRLQGPWERASLAGTVGAVDSIFYRDIELLPIGTPFTGPSAAALPKIDPPQAKGAAMPAPFGTWGLNVTVKSEEPFLIRGNLATGEVSGSMRIGGTLGSPSPDGEFKIKDFKAVLPFSTLSIRNGSVVFKPASGFDPILEIRGTAEPRPYVVTVYAYGRASNPQLVLTSNPPLPENEIMTLLATGTTTTGLEDPQAASSRAMQLLAEEIRRGRFRFGKQLRPLLGLFDRVDFSLAESDPYSSESFSTATVQLSDRWYFSAGVGSTGDSRFLGIWRISFK